MPYFGHNIFSFPLFSNKKPDKMSFTIETGLAFKILNGYFENASYVKGFEASDADKAVFDSLPEGPSPSAYPHLARWYNHIAAVKGYTVK
ncbi:uncharacterized protein BYT42DRAFT_74328 [Radiomyces spectabilis]|uniref:uncharacterized protein n=1 Tax=Radiomyces spectabilis TaxID=64574 RepID=UPI00221E5347|nr:uncharacterized protein BYT42DRAFT_74328 [Radiomyces spectabilis]KAI8371594.1 hypothetical protein BYT42DRAFT_74328 [Radiomyces spectabilis]